VRLILIRHGQTAANTGHVLDTAPPGADLSDEGHAQAEALVATLGDEPIEAIYTSDLVRTHQTAAPLARARGLTPVEHAGLREVQAGDYEGKEYWPYVEILGSWAEDPTVRMPGAENGVEFFTRFEGAIRQIAAGGHACAAVVSHGGALRIWLTATLGSRLPVDPKAPWFLDNTAHVVLDDATGRWEVVRWTDDCLRDAPDGPVPLDSPPTPAETARSQPKKAKPKAKDKAKKKAKKGEANR